MAEDRASKRYRGIDKSKPEDKEAVQTDPADTNAGAEGGEHHSGDPYTEERKAMLSRHYMELKDISRQHRDIHRSALDRHDKEAKEMVARHMGGGRTEKMNAGGKANKMGDGDE